MQTFSKMKRTGVQSASSLPEGTLKRSNKWLSTQERKEKAQQKLPNWTGKFNTFNMKGIKCLTDLIQEGVVASPEWAMLDVVLVEEMCLTTKWGDITISKRSRQELALLLFDHLHFTVHPTACTLDPNARWCMKNWIFTNSSNSHNSQSQ